MAPVFLGLALTSALGSVQSMCTFVRGEVDGHSKRRSIASRGWANRGNAAAVCHAVSSARPIEGDCDEAVLRLVLEPCRPDTQSIALPEIDDRFGVVSCDVGWQESCDRFRWRESCSPQPTATPTQRVPTDSPTAASRRRQDVLHHRAVAAVTDSDGIGRSSVAEPGLKPRSCSWRAPFCNTSRRAASSWLAAAARPYTRS